MSLLKYLRRRNQDTASVAKERLQIIISHERAQCTPPGYFPAMQEEILAVVEKYFPIQREQVSVNLERMGDRSVVFELNVTMPERELAE